ncbi:hypothetical protein BDK51DRAFT_39948 [Blyttiomyces helicus]|uniref:Uncharacterized protein n=1 Tax=Blyttiomyces helicus TaxID=388810 RepID=A0A4P9WAT8_9FUNG|nr:hypothetical protein BDK51DRAFT_39948 [Blyttiomyces helicus]|eukprot:RKO88000.1 hypothetical protein BDK51DRAFT_39948 [Blyttiomyces helicus]
MAIEGVQSIVTAVGEGGEGVGEWSHYRQHASRFRFANVHPRITASPYQQVHFLKSSFGGKRFDHPLETSIAQLRPIPLDPADLPLGAASIFKNSSAEPLPSRAASNLVCTARESQSRQLRRSRPALHSPGVVGRHDDQQRWDKKTGKAVVRQHILTCKLRRPIQRALDRLNGGALRFFADVAPAWAAEIRSMIVAGHLRRYIGRALRSFNVEALFFFAHVCPTWKSARSGEVPLKSRPDEWFFKKENDILLRLYTCGNVAKVDRFWIAHPADDKIKPKYNQPFGPGDEQGVVQLEEFKKRFHAWEWPRPPIGVAIARNRWDAVRFQVNAGFSTSRSVDVASYYNADLANVQYLFSLGDEGVATAAAVFEAVWHHREPLLRLLCAQGLPSTHTDLLPVACSLGRRSVKRKDRPDIVAYLVKNGAPIPPRLGDLAAHNNRLSVVKLLDKITSPSQNLFTHDAMNEAAGCNLEMKKIVLFLHENRTEGCTTRAMDEAAEFYVLEIVHFLHENQPEGCTVAAMDVAFRKWASQNTCMTEEMERAKDVRTRMRRTSSLPPGKPPEVYTPSCLIPAYGRGNSASARALYEAGKRFTDEEVRIRMDQPRGFRIDELKAVLREMHGIAQVRYMSGRGCVGAVVVVALHRRSHFNFPPAPPLPPAFLLAPNRV